MSVSTTVVGEGGSANLPGKLLKEIFRLGEQILKLGYVGHYGTSSPMNFGWGFGRNKRLGRVPGIVCLDIPTMPSKGFDGGVELGCVSLELRPSGHGSKETSVAH